MPMKLMITSSLNYQDSLLVSLAFDKIQSHAMLALNHNYRLKDPQKTVGRWRMQMNLSYDNEPSKLSRFSPCNLGSHAVLALVRHNYT
jgi:hypothetical protein